MPGYQVTSKYAPAAGGGLSAPGEHYTLTDPGCGVSFLRTVSFYRTPGGREVATDGIGCRIAGDGDLFRALRDAVAEYDSAARAVRQ